MTGLLTALLLPWILGISWLSMAGQRLNWQATAGYGYILGILLTTLVLRAWDSIGLALDFWSLSVFILLLSAIPQMLRSRIPKPHPALSQISENPVTARWKSLLFFGLLILLLIRYTGILLEIIWLPLYPWDAWMNWAPKAKVWFELKELAPFVSPSDWLASQDSGYTLGNVEASLYPPAVPLIQLWTALGLNEWRDDWINLPWLLSIIALGLGFYGQARLMRVAPHIAMLGTYLLLSMPYINIHTLLAGYADIWLATTVGLAAMAFFNWTTTRSRLQLLLAVLFAIAGMFIKVPGIIWAIIFLLVFVFSVLPARAQLPVLSLGIVATIGILTTGGLQFNIPGPGDISISLSGIHIFDLIHLKLQYQNVASAFQTNYLLFSNWHLFWYLFLAGTVWFIANGRIARIPLPWLVLVFTALTALLFIFFFIPRYHGAALRFVTLNRAMLHLMPMLVYFSMLASLRAYDRS